MKEISEVEKDIASIRNMMERSVKFISLSGLSGILAGIYALIGATVVYYSIHYPASILNYRMYSISESGVQFQLLIVATSVLFASLATGLWLSNRKAKKHGIKLWTTATRQLIVNLGVPLISGGLFILIVLYNGHFGIAAPACLIFYGIALIHGSSNTFEEVRYLGFSEIVLGLIAALLPGFGLLFWALGFGVLHIVYGTIMYYRYDK